MNIQLFIPTFEVEECLTEIRDCLEKGWTGLGYKTVQFEEQWKNTMGYSNAHFLASATAGLNIALEIFKDELKWGSDSEIITTPLTFVSTNHAILHSNLVPVFADVDDTLTLNPEDVISKITNKTKAIMFVGIGGNIGNYNLIKKICDENGLILILDAAHMSGSRYNNKIIGLDADVSIYSFQAVKNLPTADSGMICFKNNLYDAKCRKLTWLGINKDTYERSIDTKGTYKWKYEVEYVGHKEHGNSIMASIAIVQLKYLDRDNLRRREIANLYDNFFSRYPQLVKLVRIPNSEETSRHLYQIIISLREELISYLNKNGIHPGVHYRTNTEYSVYKKYSNNCLNASYYSESILSLPIHLRLSNQDVQYVAEKIISFYEAKKI